jgi:hypothetical protein
MVYKFAPVVVVLFLIGINLTAPAQGTLAPITPGNTVSRLPIAGQELAGGLWRTDHDFKPTLQITNVLTIAPLAVTPVLYMADGTQYSLGPYSLATSGVLAIDLRTALEEAPPNIAAHISEFGSVRIKYDWRWANAITAAVQNIDATRSLNFTFELRTPPVAAKSGDGGSSDRGETHGTGKHSHSQNIVEEGLWWKHDTGVDGFVAITNISGTQVGFTLDLVDTEGQVLARKHLRLVPEVTRFLQLSDLDPGKLIHREAGGIRIRYNGGTHDLVVVGGLENGNEGYSANIPFGILADKPNTSNAVSISAAGIMVGAPDPMMMFPAGTVFTPFVAMRNTSNRPLQVSSSISYMDGANAKTVGLTPIKLLPGEAREVDSTDLLTKSGLAGFNGSINLGLSFMGDGNDLLLATGSVDQKGTYVLPVEATGNGESASKWLKYWSVANGDDTMISIFNPGEKAEDLQMTLFFMDGQYKVPIHLDPKGSTMLMVSEIISAQQPDSDGHKIPLFIHHGSAILSSAEAVNASMNVSVSSSIFNVANATCGTTCPTCLGYVDFFVSPGSASTTIGNTLTYSAIAQNTSGGFSNVSTRANWSSSNSQVASSQGGGVFKALNAGGFGAEADIDLIDPDADCPEGQHSPCPTIPWGGEGSGTVKPTISGSAHDLWYFNGASPSAGATVFPLSLTLNTTGTGTITWTVTAGASEVHLVPGGTSATVTSSGTNFSHASLDVSIVVTVNGVQSDAFQVTTHRPYKLVMDAVQPVSCNAGFGYTQLLTLKLFDQMGTDMSIFTFDFNETFTTAAVNDNGSNWASYGLPTLTPATNNEVEDLITGVGVNNQPAPSPTPVCTGNDTQVEHWTQEWRIGGLAQGTGVRVSVEQFTRYADKANYLNLISPSDPSF